MILDREDRINHERALPWTEYGRFQMSPEPPALEVMVMTVATEATTTSTAGGSGHGNINMDEARTYRTWPQRTT